MSDSYKVYASEEYVDQRVPPSPDGTHKMLVTDADGKQVWEERTHYEDVVATPFLPETQIDFPEANIQLEFPDHEELVEGNTYLVNWDGKEYECVAAAGHFPLPVIGNSTIIGELNPGNDEPFFMGFSLSFGSTIGVAEAGTHVFSITEVQKTLKPLDAKYMPAGIEYAEKETYNSVSGGANEIVGGRKWIDVGDAPYSALLSGHDTCIVDVVSSGSIVASDGTEYFGAGKQTVEATCGIATNPSGVYVKIEPAYFPILLGADGSVLNNIYDISFNVGRNGGSAYVGKIFPSSFTGSVTVEFTVRVPTSAEAVESFTLWSETADSTKRFELAVDDNASASLTDMETGTKTKLLNETETATLIDTKLEAAHPTELITIPASAWTGTEAPYFAMNQACSIATMTNKLIVSLSPTLTSDEDGLNEMLSADTYNAIAKSKLMAVMQADGAITLAAYGKKPEIDIPVIVTEVG